MTTALAETKTDSITAPDMVAEKLPQTVEIKDIGPCKKHVKVTLEETAIRARFDEKYSDLVLKATGIVPGFRPGKAPREIVVRKYKKEVGDQVKAIILMGSLEQLAEGRGRRLLISGVNPSNKSTGDLSRWLGEALPACCIDLGYRAQNTIGNADEARDWARTWGYRSLLVVTSDFHMARSMTEFRRAMPGIKLIAHPVASRYAQPQWWASRSSAQKLAAEYMKFLASKVRLGASRMVGAFDNLMFAEREVLPVPRSGRSRRDS